LPLEVSEKIGIVPEQIVAENPVDLDHLLIVA
jgi:hypothetical protein